MTKMTWNNAMEPREEQKGALVTIHLTAVQKHMDSPIAHLDSVRLQKNA